MKNVALTTETFRANDLGLSQVIAGREFEIGNGFIAKGFRHDQFEGRMSPFLMVDHYEMSESTFGAHPHAGLAAVSLIFEDSNGRFHNRDSLGNDFDLMPGDLYWLNAGSGVIHDESPRKGAHIHGLQIFVNLPNTQRDNAPSSQHVRASNIPVVEDYQSRVRVVLGDYNGISNEPTANLHTTILDGILQNNASIPFYAKPDSQNWIYSVSGSLEVQVGNITSILPAGHAVSLESGTEAIRIKNADGLQSHFVVLSGRALYEPFVQKGPLVQESHKKIAEAEQRILLGQFGSIS